MHNLTHMGSFLVEIKYYQLHFAGRMAKLQLTSVFLTPSPLTQHCDIPHANKAANMLGVLERSSLEISHSQNVKRLQFISRLNVLHKLPVKFMIKAPPCH